MHSILAATMNAVTPIRGQKTKKQQSVPPAPVDHRLAPSLVTARKLHSTTAPATANPETTNVGGPIKATWSASSKGTDGEMLILLPTVQQAMTGL
jgi:hypothetical protein